MKKILLTAILALSVGTSAAQHYIGGKVGYGAAMITLYPKADRNSLVWGKYTGGVGWKYYSEKTGWGGLSIELEYQQRGYDIYMANAGEGISPTSNYLRKTRTVSTLTVPFILQPHLYFANQRVRLFLNAGVTFSYNLGWKDTFTLYEHYYTPPPAGSPEGTPGTVTEQTTKTDYKMNAARDVRFNYGLCVGLGVSGEVAPRLELFVEGRYYMGWSDILRTKTRYLFNEQGSIRSELGNVFFNVGFYVRLGKGGIKAPPLRWKRDRSAGTGGFGDIKLEGMRY